MGKYSKRILAMLLSLVLVLSLVPATVFATQTETADYAAVNTATGATVVK